MSKRDEKSGRWRLSAVSKLTPAGRARRRYNCGEQDLWDERASAAAQLLAGNRSAWERADGRPVSIADFGAGNERMRSLLRATLDSDHSYHPYDLHPQTPTTIQLDVVKGLPDRHFDIAICLGLLEYLPSIPDIAISLRAHCRFALTSYVIADGTSGLDREEREERHWTTHATEAVLLADFAAVGFQPRGTTRTDNGATLIVLWGQ